MVCRSLFIIIYYGHCTCGQRPQLKSGPQFWAPCTKHGFWSKKLADQMGTLYRAVAHGHTAKPKTQTFSKYLIPGPLCICLFPKTGTQTLTPSRYFHVGGNSPKAPLKSTQDPIALDEPAHTSAFVRLVLNYWAGEEGQHSCSNSQCCQMGKENRLNQRKLDNASSLPSFNSGKATWHL